MQLTYVKCFRFVCLPFIAPSSSSFFLLLLLLSLRSVSFLSFSLDVNISSYNFAFFLFLRIFLIYYQLIDALFLFLIEHWSPHHSILWFFMDFLDRQFLWFLGIKFIGGDINLVQFYASNFFLQAFMDIKCYRFHELSFPDYISFLSFSIIQLLFEISREYLRFEDILKHYDVWIILLTYTHSNLVNYFLSK